MRLKLGHFALFQLAWLAMVMGAAHGHAYLGCLAIAPVLVLHLALARYPGREVLLLGSVTLVGLAAETLQLRLGHVRYAGVDAESAWPAPWLLLLWTLLGTTLNVSMRWLRGRPLLAACLAAIGGPAAFASGARLGPAQFVDATAALVSSSLLWSVLLPLMLALARRLDGFVPVSFGSSNA
ncbi:MAG: DUF2878 domain-containing protein [Proteobacteria bacterium]|nr:DUF2878 domain-containing protein [Pseudomonadota bacterium]